LSVPTGATIQGIEVRVRKRLRSGSSVYSDIDYVKVRVYYEPASWTLDIDNIVNGYSNVAYISESSDIYLEWVPDDIYNINLNYITQYSTITDPNYWWACYSQDSWTPETLKSLTGGNRITFGIRCPDIPSAQLTDVTFAQESNTRNSSGVLKSLLSKVTKDISAAPPGGGDPSPDPCSGTIRLREGNSSGRIVSEFTYYDDGTSGAPTVCPAP